MLAAKRRKEKSLDVVSVKAPRTSQEKMVQEWEREERRRDAGGWRGEKAFVITGTLEK